MSESFMYYPSFQDSFFTKKKLNVAFEICNSQKEVELKKREKQFFKAFQEAAQKTLQESDTQLKNVNEVLVDKICFFIPRKLTYLILSQKLYLRYLPVVHFFCNFDYFCDLIFAAVFTFLCQKK